MAPLQNARDPDAAFLAVNCPRFARAMCPEGAVVGVDLRPLAAPPAATTLRLTFPSARASHEAQRRSRRRVGALDLPSLSTGCRTARRSYPRRRSLPIQVPGTSPRSVARLGLVDAGTRPVAAVGVCRKL